jgi:hypothetical protein
MALAGGHNTRLLIHRAPGVPCSRRFSGNAIAFDGLSALTQLTRLASDYAGSTQREALYSQLAQLTGLRELDAPMALQTDGGVATPATRLPSRIDRIHAMLLSG